MSGDGNSGRPEELAAVPVVRPVQPAAASGPATAEVETIQLLEEALQVAKRTVERGRVRVSVLTETEEMQVRETLGSRRVEVERVAVGRRLAAGDPVPQPRTEGDVLIVPVVEEVLVVEKRLVVAEELHIRTVESREDVQHAVPLRRQRAVVERLSLEGRGSEP